MSSHLEIKWILWNKMKHQNSCRKYPKIWIVVWIYLTLRYLKDVEGIANSITLIRLLLKEHSGLSAHHLLRPICSKTDSGKNYNTSQSHYNIAHSHYNIAHCNILDVEFDCIGSWSLPFHLLCLYRWFQMIHTIPIFLFFNFVGYNMV